MTLPIHFEEVTDLVWALVNDRLDASSADRLQDLLDADAANRRVYIELMDQFAALEWEKGNGRSDQWASSSSFSPERRLGASVPSEATIAFPIPNPQSPIPNFVIQQSLPSPVTTLHSPLSTLHSYVGSAVFSYLAAVMIVGVGLLVAWAWKLPDASQIVRQAVPSPSPLVPDSSSKMQFVGRITGMVDCQWDGSLPSPACGRGAGGEGSLQLQSSVHLHDRFALLSGLMEISYDTGAKVILQGPCTYEVESSAGGFLSVGKLTAKLEKKNNSPRPSDGRGAGGEGDTNSPRPSDGRGAGGEGGGNGIHPSSLILHPLFSVRTPTAIVTDLGTEFGVEVDKEGQTESHVFRGTVELRVRGPSGKKDHVIVLSEHESARVESDADAPLTVRRITSKPEAFVHRLLPPRPTPLDTFSTGVGLAAGQVDPHWQLAAVSNEPDFKPRPAFVSPDCAIWLKNEPARSQWLSVVGDGSAVPNGIAFTFRTSFDLAALSPAAATLRIRFMADNLVRAIRFNGRELQVPQHGKSPPYDIFHPMTVTRGFVEGVNVLEFDVENVNELSPEQLSADRMGLRVELEGTGIQQRAEMQRSP